jgi:hypothetical protein
MHHAKRTIIAMAVAAAVTASAGLAAAPSSSGNAVAMIFPETKSYTGVWSVTIAGSQFSDGTDCLTLNGNTESGQASLVVKNQKYPYGSFIIVNGIMMVNITEPLYGQNGALMFAAPANDGHIRKGIFENVEGGSNFDYGAVRFRKNGSC